MKHLSDDRLEHLRAVVDLPDLTATKYEVLRKLDRGGMGTIYAARDTELDREVALKVLSAPDPGDDLSVRLLEEAKQHGLGSTAPDPEVVSTTRSFCVLNTSFTPAVTRSMSAANSGPRWSIISAAPACATSSGTGVGPGMRRFTVTPSSRQSRKTVFRQRFGAERSYRRLRSGSTNTLPQN